MLHSCTCHIFPALGLFHTFLIHSTPIPWAWMSLQTHTKESIPLEVKAMGCRMVTGQAQAMWTPWGKAKAMDLIYRCTGVNRQTHRPTVTHTHADVSVRRITGGIKREPSICLNYAFHYVSLRLIISSSLTLQSWWWASGKVSSPLRLSKFSVLSHWNQERSLLSTSALLGLFYSFPNVFI